MKKKSDDRANHLEAAECEGQIGSAFKLFPALSFVEEMQTPVERRSRVAISCSS